MAFVFYFGFLLDAYADVFDRTWAEHLNDRLSPLAMVLNSGIKGRFRNVIYTLINAITTINAIMI